MAVVVCANGLGHLRRVMAVLDRLMVVHGDLNAVVFLASWQIPFVQRSPALARAEGRLHPSILELPLVWLDHPESYEERTTTTLRSLGAAGFDRFDLVVSDNLVEPLAVADRVLLMGSFLWHDILRTAWPHDGAIGRYHEHMSALLSEHRPTMVSNRYFTMPEVERSTNTCQTGMMGQPASSKRPSDKDSKPIRLLVATGNSKARTASFRRAMEILENYPELDIYGDSTLLERIPDLRGRWTGFDFDSGRFPTVDVALIRAGMGTISECVAAGIPMIVLQDANPEIQFNADRVVGYGIGIPAGDMEEEGSPITSGETRRRMRAAMSDFSFAGIAEAAGAISAALGRVNSMGTGAEA